jgi:N-acetylglucosaminyldiphosphoundecaprenol N-acetyl-beta-D-mannosaminyltransferase
MYFSIGDHKVKVSAPTRDGLLCEIASRLRLSRGFAVATLNLDHLVKLSSEAFRDAYSAHDLITADGNPIVWMSRLAGRPVELVTGSDLVRPLAELAATQGTRIGMFGSTTDTLDLAARRLKTVVPGLDISLCMAPPMGFAPDGEEAEAAIRAYQAAGVQMIFVALGAPKQEIFAALGRRIAPEMGFVSIGAGLDFIAGRQSRAPVWIRKMALEWMWRLALDPRRMAARYLKCFTVLPGHVLDAIEIRRERNVAAATAN